MYRFTAQFPPRQEPEYYGYSHGLFPPRSLLDPALEAKHNELASRAVPKAMPSGWAYQGCLEESNGQRLLQGFAFSSGQTSQFTCASVCGTMGYEYSGTQYSNEVSRHCGVLSFGGASADVWTFLAVLVW